MSYRVLLYPNITYQKNLATDSYVVLLRPMLEQFARLRPEWEFVAPLPEYVPSLRDLPNVRQVPYPLPTYPNTMRIHFDTVHLRKILDLRNRSYDVVFSHLPEHTLALRNLFANSSNETPTFVGYTHWSEFPEITGYSATVLDVNLLGLLEMRRCGINTQAQKDLLLHHAEKRLAPDRVLRLDEIVRPMYLGAEEPEFDPRGQTRTIVFNHRPHTYKGYPEFLEAVRLLRERRTDFDVWVPLETGTPPEDWIRYGENDTRYEYLSNLSRCYVGVGMAQKYAGWSVAVTDGLSVGTPWVLHDEPSFRELAGDVAWYHDSVESLVGQLDRLLDLEPGEYLALRRKSSGRFADSKWDKRILPFVEMIDDAIAALPEIGSRSKRIEDLADMIDREGPKTKKELTDAMRWGVNINWTPYRTALRSRGYEIRGDTYGPRRG